MIDIQNRDCMDLLRETPDKYFDLAIVDPPYGLGIDGQKQSLNKNPKHDRKAHARKGWDASIPTKEYFDQLFRVSKNQIIWGGNYFTQHLPPVKGWIFWYKGQNDLTMSDGEMAWTSLPIVTRQIDINRVELLKDNTIHPTQKPVLLYRHLLRRYAKEGFKILDTHLGSGSHAIAIDNMNTQHGMNLSLTATEIDKDYYEASLKRLANHQKQLKLI